MGQLYTSRAATAEHSYYSICFSTLRTTTPSVHRENRGVRIESLLTDEMSIATVMYVVVVTSRQYGRRSLHFFVTFPLTF